MPASVSITSSLLLVLMWILSPMHGMHIVGHTCVVDNSPGVCKLLQDCPKVYKELVDGKLPSETCGFEGFNPIICCPTTKLKKSRGSVARAKCAENAESIETSLCARRRLKRIVGGKKAEAKEFPHMAAIGFNNSSDNSSNISWFCGGSLISKKIVLTTAFCTYRPDWGSANWVRLGDLNLVETTDNAKPQTIAIEERIRHPDYKPPSEYHDIAILRLKKEVTYDAYVRPACLPVDWPDVGDNDKAVATGWGLVDWAEDTGSDNLLKVTLNLVSHKSCNTSFLSGDKIVELEQGIIDEWQICAGEVGKDTCQGDSGGPLAVFNDDHECMYNIIGLTSLGRLCGSIIPSVYTRVYHYVPWIEKVAWPEDF